MFGQVLQVIQVKQVMQGGAVHKTLVVTSSIPLESL